MTNNYKLLVFDWDGTLMDSQARIVSCFLKAIDDLDFEKREPNQLRSMIGLSLKTAIEHLYPELSSADHDNLVIQYRQHYFSDQVLPAMPFPDVKETLQQLAEKEYWLAVATGKGRRGLNESMEENGLKEFFLITRCAEETSSKPDPHMLNEIMEELDVSPAQTLMIGDTEFDLEMAKNAGVASIGVSYGVHSTESLMAWQPLACFDTIAQLPQWLENV